MVNPSLRWVVFPLPKGKEMQRKQAESSGAIPDFPVTWEKLLISSRGAFIGGF